MSLYDNLFLATQHLAPHHLVSRMYGVAAQCRIPAAKNWMIDTFIRKYHVDMSQALQPDPHAYEHFNAFFTRALRADARPLDPTPGAVLCPTDGVVSQIGDIADGRIFQAKGHGYSTEDLLGGSPTRAAPFANGSFATIYLAPKDYHRVHMPATGTLREMVYVPGRLFSVNPLTARNVPALFARNERVVCIFDTELGPMAVVLVGAMIVASIETVWSGTIAPRSSAVQAIQYGQPESIALEKGQEMGRFKLGSTVIVLFGRDRVDWLSEIQALSPVRMGEALGDRVHTAPGKRIDVI